MSYNRRKPLSSGFKKDNRDLKTPEASGHPKLTLSKRYRLFRLAKKKRSQLKKTEKPGREKHLIRQLRRINDILRKENENEEAQGQGQGVREERKEAAALRSPSGFEGRGTQERAAG